MYKYETHLHTFPVSKCAKRSVRENLEFYKRMGYDGVFITNHFVDANINIDKARPYEEKINFYFSDYEAAIPIAKEIGIKVFLGVETGSGGHFLVYGLDKEWYLRHPEIMEMKYKEQLEFFRAAGALVIHAHPFREAAFVDYIRLFPRSVDGVEVLNSSRTDFENRLADQYADNYELLKIAGSDNHGASRQKALAGVCTETPIVNEDDFIRRVRARETKIFTLINEEANLVSQT